MYNWFHFVSMLCHAMPCIYSHNPNQPWPVALRFSLFNTADNFICPRFVNWQPTSANSIKFCMECNAEASSAFKLLYSLNRTFSERIQMSNAFRFRWKQISWMCEWRERDAEGWGKGGGRDVVFYIIALYGLWSNHLYLYLWIFNFPLS